MILLSHNLGDLSDSVCWVQVKANNKLFPNEYATADEAWKGLTQSTEMLRSKLGSGRADQIAEMLGLARRHYEQDETQMGSRLMQDVGRIIEGKAPFAYPPENYPWPREAGIFALMSRQ